MWQKKKRCLYLWAWYPPWHRFTKAYRCLRAYSYCNKREKTSHTQQSTSKSCRWKRTRKPVQADCSYLLPVPVKAVFLVVLDGSFITFILCEFFTSFQVILHFPFLLHHMLHDLTHGITKQLPHLHIQTNIKSIIIWSSWLKSVTYITYSICYIH